MFFKKSINLTAYTYEESYLLTAKPTFKSAEKPNWLKKLGGAVSIWDEKIGLYNKIATANTCPGIKDFLSLPIQINMWADVDIRINPDGSWTSNARPDWDIYITEHPKFQFGEAYNDRIALKLDTPWMMYSDSDTKFLFVESHYSTSYFRDLGVLLPPGVTNFKYQHSTNIHLNCPIKPEPYVISLKHGMPLVSLFPMTDKHINFDVKKVPHSDFREMNQHYPKINVGRYFKQAGFKK